MLFTGEPLVMAKRAAPKPVAPVVLRGVEFRAPLSVDQIGFVEAWDAKAQKLLWKKRIYREVYLPFRERDVQWTFIDQLKIIKEEIHIRNEDGKWFSLNPETRKVMKLKQKKKVNQ